MNKNLLILSILVLSVVNIKAGTPLVLLHTNDTHSQLEPYRSDDKYNADMGGIVRRAALIREVRSKEPNVLVVDAGDFVQGTPYYNLFKGEAEINLMNKLGLNAVTLGNHEFDNGILFLSNVLRKANFKIVCSNYDVSATKLKKYVHSWLIVKKGKLRIGIVSANISPNSLISPINFEGIKYSEPYETAEAKAAWLKTVKKCDLVVCLSHLGFDNKGDAPDDIRLAEKTKSIDVIIGGHTHTFMRSPLKKINAIGDTVLINQVGKGGIYVGRMDLDVN
ncbi:MAG TPA: metallophosphatase [Bacteroidales bacterium]|nr:metallophosphatase [Bacteroidales bacterium]